MSESQAGEKPSNGNGVSIGLGSAKLSARGNQVILVLCVLAIIGSNLYAGYRLEQTLLGIDTKMRIEHRDIASTNDRTACAVTMSQAERERFRNEYRPGAWSRWCPWIRE